MMSCGDPAGSREKKFVAMLRSADGYKINGDFLLLTSDGKTVAKFKNNPPNPDAGRHILNPRLSPGEFVHAHLCYLCHSSVLLTSGFLNAQN